MFSWECGVLRVSAVCFNPKPYSRRHVSATFWVSQISVDRNKFFPSVKGVFKQGEEGRVVLTDVLAAGRLGPDEGTVALVIGLSLVNGSFESSRRARVSVDVIRELAGVDFLDFSNSCSDLGFVSSASAVLKLD